MLPGADWWMRSTVNFRSDTSHASSTPWSTAFSGSSENSTEPLMRSKASSGEHCRMLSVASRPAELNAVFQDRQVLRVMLEPLCKIPPLVAEAIEQQLRVMPRRHDLRALGVHVAIPHPHLVCAVHELGDHIKTEPRVSESLDAPLRRKQHMGIFDRELKTILVQHESPKVVHPGLLRQ